MAVQRVCVDGKKRRTQMKGEGRKDEYRDQINKRGRFRGSVRSPMLNSGMPVFPEIEISPSTGKPIRFLDGSLTQAILRCKYSSLKQPAKLKQPRNCDQT